MAAVQKIDYQVHPGAWFRQALLFPVFGLSTDAAKHYRAKGIWLEGKHYRTDPANCLVYNRAEIEKWMAGQA